MARLDIDHRWGVRKSINLKVQLICQLGAIAPGWLTDVSLSGAFVRTELAIPALSTVRIVVVDRLSAGWRSVDLSAYVARCDGGGLGLEWWNLNAETLQRLFSVTGPAQDSAHRQMAGLPG